MLNIYQIIPVTPILVFTVTGNMATAIAFVTVGFAVTATATTTSTTSAESCAVDRASLTAVPGKMSGTVAPIAHNSTTHGWGETK